MKKTAGQLKEDLLSIIENKGRCIQINNVRNLAGKNKGLCGLTKCYLARYCLNTGPDILPARDIESPMIVKEALHIAAKKGLIKLEQIFDMGL